MHPPWLIGTGVALIALVFRAIADRSSQIVADSGGDRSAAEQLVCPPRPGFGEYPSNGGIELGVLPFPHSFRRRKPTADSGQ